MSLVYQFEPNLETTYAALINSMGIEDVFTSVTRKTLTEEFVSVQVNLDGATTDHTVSRTNGQLEYSEYSYELVIMIQSNNNQDGIDSDLEHRRLIGVIRDSLSNSYGSESVGDQSRINSLSPLYDSYVLVPGSTTREVSPDTAHLVTTLSYSSKFTVKPEAFDPDERLLEVLDQIHQEINNISVRELYA